MTMQWLRTRKGQRIGFAVLFGPHRVHEIDFVDASAPGNYRLCDACRENAAYMFCRTHSLFLCDPCVSEHYVKPYLCHFVGLSAAAACMRGA
jgi:hypothetical protein